MVAPVLATAASICAIAAVVLAAQGVAREVSRDTPAPTPQVTAEVRAGSLTEHVDASGLVRAEYRVAIRPPQLPDDSEPIITWVPESGKGIGAGQRLLDVAGQPVFVLDGDIPMYRALSLGTEGPDVGQLQTALRGLGYDVDDDEGNFGRSTAWALVDLFDSQGTTAVDASGEPLPPWSADGISIPLGTFVFAPGLPASLSADCRRVGASLSDGGDCYLESDAKTAYVKLTQEQSSRVETGMPVIASYPDGAVVTGELGDRAPSKTELASDNGAESDESEGLGASDEASAEAGEGAQTESDGTKDSGMVEYYLALSELPSQSVSDFSVSISVRTTAEDSILVPETAIYRDAAGDFSVRVSDVTDGKKLASTVAVEVGLCADGECEITKASRSLMSATLIVSPN